MRRDSLRARRTLNPGPLEALERRQLFAVVSFDTSTRELTITGGSGADNIAISESGTGNVTLGGNASGSFSGVAAIVVNTGAGNDTVTYNVTSTVTSAEQELIVDLGSGDDTFSGDLHNWNVNAGAALVVEAFARDGNDVENFNAVGTSTDRPNVYGELDVVLNTGTVALGLVADNDTATINYHGKVTGLLDADIVGGDGDDRLTEAVTLDAGSTGRFGVAGEPSLVSGDGGSDTLDFRVTDNSGGSADVFAKLDGGFSLFDNDFGRHTANVVATGLESESIVSAFLQRTVTSKVRVGQTASISGTIFAPDAGTSFFVDVDWGDGTKQTFSFPPGTFTSGTTRVSLNHVYRAKGKYHIQFQWRDDFGLANADDADVHVLPAGGPS
jgi:hypothetical protein